VPPIAAPHRLQNPLFVQHADSPSPEPKHSRYKFPPESAPMGPPVFQSCLRGPPAKLGRNLFVPNSQGVSTTPLVRTLSPRIPLCEDFSAILFLNSHFVFLFFRFFITDPRYPPATCQEMDGISSLTVLRLTYLKAVSRTALFFPRQQKDFSRFYPPHSNRSIVDSPFFPYF